MVSIASFIFFTGLVGFISWWRTRHDDHGDSQSYFLAGKSLPWFVVAGSLMLTNLSTEQLIGLNGGAYLGGAVVMAWEVVAALALVILALYFLPRYWNSGITTVPQMLETRQILSGLFLVFLVLNFLPFVVYSGAVGMNGLFDVDEVLGVSTTSSIWIMVWSIGTIGSLYAIFGGLKAVAVSDTINGVGLLVGGLAIPILGLMALGDGSMGAGIDRIRTNQASQISPIGAKDSVIPFSTLFTGMVLINVYYWCTNQAIVQRTFGAKSLREGQKGVMAAAFLKLLGPLYLVLPGIIALEMFGNDLGNGDSAYPQLVAAVLPPYFAGLFGYGDLLLLHVGHGRNLLWPRDALAPFCRHQFCLPVRVHGRGRQVEPILKCGRCSQRYHVSRSGMERGAHYLRNRRRSYARSLHRTPRFGVLTAGCHVTRSAPLIHVFSASTLLRF